MAKKKAAKKLTLQPKPTKVPARRRPTLEQLLKRYRVTWFYPQRKPSVAIEKLRDKAGKGRQLSDKDLDILTSHSEPLRSLLQQQNDCDRVLFDETTEYLELLDVIVEQLELGETDDTLEVARNLQARVRLTQDATSKGITEYENRFPEDEWESHVDAEG